MYRGHFHYEDFFQDLLHSKKKWVGGGDGPSDFSVSTSPNWTFGIIIGSLGTGIGTSTRA